MTNPRATVKKKKRKGSKKASKKRVYDRIWSNEEWHVVEGELQRPQGRPEKIQPLFKYVGEKLPIGSLREVRKVIKAKSGDPEGIYMAHDSMGVARYGGRGKIFDRLYSHQRKYPKELVYFSFYVIKSKNHERELETVVLRAAGPQMILNTKKVRSSIDAGNISDYEPGTLFFSRQFPKGKRKRKRKSWKSI